MADVSAITGNYLTVAKEAQQTTLDGPVTAGATTVAVIDASAYTDGDWTVQTVDPGTSDQATFYGQKSGNQFISVVWTEGNLAADHISGATIVDYVSATAWDLIKKLIATQHNANGTHGAVTATSLSVGTGAANSFANVLTGWVEASLNGSAQTWVYASGTTLTNNSGGDVTSLFVAGTKIKFTQSAATKYFYVLSSSYSAPNTTITIIGSSDYTLTNNTITSPFYSYAATPIGFPASFNFVPVWTNLTIGNATVTAFYTINGKWLDFYVKVVGGSTTTIGTDPSFAPPTAFSTSIYSRAVTPIGNALYFDTSGTAYFTGPCGISVSASGANIQPYVNGSASTYTGPVGYTATIPIAYGTGDEIHMTGRIRIT